MKRKAEGKATGEQKMATNHTSSQPEHDILAKLTNSQPILLADAVRSDSIRIRKGY